MKVFRQYCSIYIVRPGLGSLWAGEVSIAATDLWSHDTLCILYFKLIGVECYFVVRIQNDQTSDKTMLIVAKLKTAAGTKYWVYWMWANGLNVLWVNKVTKGKG